MMIVRQLRTYCFLRHPAKRRAGLFIKAETVVAAVITLARRSHRLTSTRNRVEFAPSNFQPRLTWLN